MWSGPRPGRPAKAPRTSGTRDCSPVAPSTGVPTECRRTPAAARRSAIAPEGSRDVLRWRKASQGYGSAHSRHPGPVPGSSAEDGSLAPGPPARCTKTTRPDPQMRLACSSPAIRDDKVNHQVLTVASGFFSKLLERFRAKWKPVRVKKTRQIKDWSLRSDSIGTEKALAARL